MVLKNCSVPLMCVLLLSQIRYSSLIRTKFENGGNVALRVSFSIDWQTTLRHLANKKTKYVSFRTAAEINVSTNMQLESYRRRVYST